MGNVITFEKSLDHLGVMQTEHIYSQKQGLDYVNREAEVCVSENEPMNLKSDHSPNVSWFSQIPLRQNRHAEINKRKIFNKSRFRTFGNKYNI